MLAKLNKTHGSNKNYVKPRSDLQASFGFNHFAGVVFYDARGTCAILQFQDLLLTFDF